MLCMIINFGLRGQELEGNVIVKSAVCGYAQRVIGPDLETSAPLEIYSPPASDSCGIVTKRRISLQSRASSQHFFRVLDDSMGTWFVHLRDFVPLVSVTPR